MKRAHFLLLAGVLFLAGCAGTGVESNESYAHLTAVGNRYFPDPGYKWDRVDANGHPVPGDLAVHWAPGSGYWRAGEQTFEHVAAGSSEGMWYPRAGYSWDNPASTEDLHVHWVPGHVYEENGVISQPHLLASATEGRWWPAPGYTWDRVDASGNPYTGDMAVHWVPGRAYYKMGQNTYPHVVASENEGKWWPAPGYKWAHVDANGKTTDLAVEWSAGSSYSGMGRIVHANVRAAKKEGDWYPAPGYKWSEVDASGTPLAASWEVKWTPGETYRDLGEVVYAHVEASQKEGEWVPAKGYAWANSVEGDFAVVTAGAGGTGAGRATVGDVPAGARPEGTGADVVGAAAPGARRTGG